MRAGLVTNPGEFVLGQPGTGKSTLVKRQITGAVATGTRAIILGDTKPDYTLLIGHLGGQVIRQAAATTINPLDAGPLGAALRRMTGPDAQALRWEVRSRRLSLLMALCTLVRESRLTNAEEVILGRAIDLLDERRPPGSQPAVPDVLAVIEQAPDILRAAARTDTPAAFCDRTADLVFTLDLLCTGSLAGVFDGPTTRPIDLDAPAVSVDISRVGAPGDKLLTAAMLCTWAYGFGVVDAAAALADQQLATRRSYMGVMDELWRALRAGPGRVRRQPDPAQPGQGHVQRDDHPLPRRPGRPGHRGRSRQGPRVRRAQRDHRLRRAAAPRAGPGLRDRPLTGPERELVTSWSAPDSWQPGARHPGRGKYLIKAGERLGIPVELTLVGAEYMLYDTDQAIRIVRPGSPR